MTFDERIAHDGADLRLPDSNEHSEWAFSRQRLWVWVALMVVLGVTAGIRLRLLDIPLERDEGEYALTGQSILRGIPPYAEVYTMKWPGTGMAYAGILSVLGQTPKAIHLGLLFVNLASAVLVFIIGRRMGGDLAGVVAAASFSILCLGPGTLGLAAHATHFVTLPALGCVALCQTFHDATRQRRVFFAGLLAGLAMLAKQPGAAFAVFGVCWMAWLEWQSEHRSWARWGKRVASFGAGVAVPLLATLAWLVGSGVFGQFWLWTIRYAGAYASEAGLAGAGGRFALAMESLWEDAPGLWICAGVGLVVMLAGKGRFKKHERAFVLGLLGCSFLAVCPGWYFREHYFIQWAPAIGLVTGMAVAWARTECERAFPGTPWHWAPVVAYLVAVVAAMNTGAEIYFRLDAAGVSRKIYEANPFPESIEIARYLRTHCPADARIAVIGSEPQIYFYSGLRPATGYIYTYPLMENQPFAGVMAAQMAGEIEARKPAYVVMVCIADSWLPKTDSDYAILRWAQTYLTEKYQQVGRVQLMAEDKVEYNWDFQKNPTPLQTQAYLEVYQIKPDAGERR